MKRLLVSFAFVLTAAAAFGQAADRDVVVTPDGTVYTVEAQTPPADSSMVAMQTLALTIQNGKDVSHLYVPDSMTSGFHFGGALAYDSDSSTLFVLWIHTDDGYSTELLLTSFHGGKWEPAVSIDNDPYRRRSNLRLGITRRVSQLQTDGTFADVPALLLHAVWWEESGKSEAAHYALLTTEKGALSSIEIHSLEEFIAPADEAYNAVDPTFNKELLRHPAIVSPPMQSGVDVVFGDTKSNTIHTVTLRPIADARVHIPVGIGGGNGGPKPRSLAAPPTFSADWKGSITVIERADRLVFANASETSLSYITYANGAWTSVKSIAIDSRFPAEAALAAIDKMLSTQ
ncbi:MAG TPA: hypothetical protein VN380_00765 [Thermoanaerobaculia bacterium]|jgi:hypothetical protein|nr:hypothetical protein [Thermoanaerobaculia bacterium]